MKKLAGAIAAATAVLVLLGMLAGPTFAKPYFRNPVCSVSDQTVSPGDDITVSGKRWGQQTTVRIFLVPEQILLGTATVDDEGMFSITVTIPADIRPGPHRIVCRGENSFGRTKVRGSNITVLSEVVAAGAGAAFTGATTNVPLWAGLAGVLALAGVAALFAARLRRRRAGPDLSP